MSSRFDIALGRIPTVSEESSIPITEQPQCPDNRGQIFDLAFQLYREGFVSINTILNLLNIDPQELKE